jgi:hypothetical protein
MATGKGDLYYAREKTSLAVSIMATTTGSIQERLLNGWMREGHHALPMGEGQAGLPMSDELIESLEAFNDRMSCRPALGDEGTFSATILALSDDEASAAARDLVEISYQIEAEIEDAR